MRHSKDTIRQARDVVRAFKLDETHGLKAYELMGDIVNRAKRLHTLAEKACNGELSPRDEALEKGYEEAIRKDAQELGLSVKFSGDPRGYVVKLHGPEGRHNWNTWGGKSEGWGVG